MPIAGYKANALADWVLVGSQKQIPPLTGFLQGQTLGPGWDPRAGERLALGWCFPRGAAIAA